MAHRDGLQSTAPQPKSHFTMSNLRIATKHFDVSTFYTQSSNTSIEGRVDVPKMVHKSRCQKWCRRRAPAQRGAQSWSSPICKYARGPSPRPWRLRPPPFSFSSPEPAWRAVSSTRAASRFDGQLPLPAPPASSADGPTSYLSLLPSHGTHDSRARLALRALSKTRPPCPQHSARTRRRRPS